MFFPLNNQRAAHKLQLSYPRITQLGVSDEGGIDPGRGAASGAVRGAALPPCGAAPHLQLQDRPRQG